MPYISASRNSGKPVKIYYEEWGEGQPLVLIHGWPVDHRMWEYQITQLPLHGFRVIAYDRRGFGHSDKPWDGYDYNTLATDLKDLLDELDLRNAILVGFSMAGGELARYATMTQSARISKLIFVSSIVPYLLKTEDNPDGAPREAFEGFEKELLADRPAFLEEFGKHFFNHKSTKFPVSEYILSWMKFLALHGSPKATLECLNAFAYTDFRAELPRINVPTLILHGTKDQTVPIDPTSRHAAKLIPHAILKEYENASHGVFYTHCEELNKDIIQFSKNGTV